MAREKYSEHLRDSPFEGCDLIIINVKLLLKNESARWLLKLLNFFFKSKNLKSDFRKIIMGVIEIIMDMKKDVNQYFGTTPILESEPIGIPNAKQCCVNHGLVAAVPCEDITLGAFKRKPFCARLKSLQRQKREIDERNRKEAEERNREFEKAILENYMRNDGEA